jgi:hypothetical protein
MRGTIVDVAIPVCAMHSCALSRRRAWVTTEASADQAPEHSSPHGAFLTFCNAVAVVQVNSVGGASFLPKPMSHQLVE